MTLADRVQLTPSQYRLILRYSAILQNFSSKNLIIVYCSTSKIKCLTLYIIHSSPALMFTLYPSCVHTTLAALLSQELLQTLPHTPWMQTSTLPALSTGPSTKRTVPLVQGRAAIQGEMYCVCMCRWSHVPPMYCIVLWQYSSPFVFISKGPKYVSSMSSSSLSQLLVFRRKCKSGAIY